MEDAESKLIRAHGLIHDEPDEALRIVNDVLNKDFDEPRALFMAAYIMTQAERKGLAYNLYRRVQELLPNDSRVLHNMGMCFDNLDHEKALALFNEALRIDPEDTSALSNKALMLLKMGDPVGAEKYSRKALRIDRQMTAAHDNLGLALLFQRKWKEGWREYQWGLGGKHRKKLDFGVPEWDGKAPGHVIIYGEQGIGDEIMFASCIPDAMAIAEVTIVCDSRLAGVFKRSFGCHVSGTRHHGETLLHAPADYQCSIGDLPRFFRNKHADFPGKPFLTADPERVIQWKALLDTMPGKKIGIAWSGGLDTTGRSNRSFDLDDLAPLFRTDNTFISLEYKQPDEKKLAQYGIHHWDRAVLKGVDYDETLALIESCDLIISATTTAIYGAGALGKECWCLVPKKPHYRYHLSGDLPWFKSVKLMRQTGSWAELACTLAGKLGEQ